MINAPNKKTINENIDKVRKMILAFSLNFTYNSELVICLFISKFIKKIFEAETHRYMSYFLMAQKCSTKENCY